MREDDDGRYDTVFERLASGGATDETGIPQEKLHPGTARDVNQFEEIIADMTVAFSTPGSPGLPEKLKSKILGRVEARVPSVVTGAFDLSPEEIASEAVVVTGLDKFVQWVSPAFCDMCGYSVEELRGRRLGPLLQGPLTDPHAVDVVRQAIRRFEPVTQEMVNYHKDGEPYWVQLSIRTSFSPDGKPLAYVAIEQKISDRALPASA